MSYLKRTDLFAPSWLSVVGVILQIIGAFALVAWISSWGGGTAKGAVPSFNASAIPASAAQ